MLDLKIDNEGPLIKLLLVIPACAGMTWEKYLTFS
jgi:hypothetical protein